MIDYEISALDSNKTILQHLKDIQQYLKNNPIYKIYSIETNYVSGTSIYDLSYVHNPNDNTLAIGDVVVFINGYYAFIASVGEDEITIENAENFKGDKGDTGDTGATGATGVGISSITKTGTSGLIDTYTITYTDGTTSTYTITNGAQGEQGETGATGATGATGNGIASIAKTSTSGLVDTYTITYTDNTTSTFNITNGNGIASIAKTGTSGLIDTYTITYTDGTTSTYTITNGADGSGATKRQLTLAYDSYSTLDTWQSNRYMPIAYDFTTYTPANGNETDIAQIMLDGVIQATPTVSFYTTYFRVSKIGCCGGYGFHAISSSSTWELFARYCMDASTYITINGTTYNCGTQTEKEVYFRYNTSKTYLGFGIRGWFRNGSTDKRQFIDILFKSPNNDSGISRSDFKITSISFS